MQAAFAIAFFVIGMMALPPQGIWVDGNDALYDFYGITASLMLIGDALEKTGTRFFCDGRYHDLDQEGRTCSTRQGNHLEPRPG